MSELDDLEKKIREWSERRAATAEAKRRATRWVESSKFQRV